MRKIGHTWIGIPHWIIRRLGKLELPDDLSHQIHQRLRRADQCRFRVLSDVVRERERDDP